ncbi:4-oxalocrotonate tautomerase [candidate division WOR-3 bacterium]|uniref:4-oxalocrotonate tautomerase n=1 Tax=candidate division WOR-3 bacterium TaxID=2052148 RepID=A0A660SDV6_UNCW3|nr:MAG: 4-oxalocrotonate tautomerase [candidate division WOR-3 bacterium]
MPIITIEGPPIGVEKKRELARRLTKVAEDIYGIKHIIVLIRENKPENVASSGELICDKKSKRSE